MSNVKISALPEYSGNPTGGYSVFNNSGETTTYKVRNYNLFGNLNTIGADSKYPFVVGSGNTLDNLTNVAIGYGNTMTGGFNRDGGLNANMIVGNNNSITDSYSSNVIIVGQNNTNGGWNSMVVGQNNTVNYGLDGIVAGNNNTSAVEYSFVFGTSNNSTSQGGFIVGAGNTAQGYAISYEAPFVHGFNNSTVMSHAIGILGGRFNAITGVMYDSDARPYYDCIIGGEYNTIGTYITGSTIVGSSYSTITGTSGTTKNSNIFGGSGNTITSSTKSTILGSKGSVLNSANYSQIFGGENNSLVSNNYSSIIGGSGNTMASSISAANGKGNYIINSRDCAVEKDGQYQSNNVNYIACDNIRTENLQDVTFINVKNISAENGGVESGTTIMRNTYTLGASLFQADTYTSTGATNNIVINPKQQDYIEINTDGSSTYNISFTFVDSAIYANIHLYISYVAGSTVNFVNGANTQWRFANGVAPVFSGTNRNIIVMSTWANDDVWEVSRSMYM
jgi:hypothetical protein